MNDYLIHYGIKSMKWGIRRFQNEDGTLTPAGKARYGVASTSENTGSRTPTLDKIDNSIRKRYNSVKDFRKNYSIGDSKATKLAYDANQTVDNIKNKINSVGNKGLASIRNYRQKIDPRAATLSEVGINQIKERYKTMDTGFKGVGQVAKNMLDTKLAKYAGKSESEIVKSIGDSAKTKVKTASAKVKSEYNRAFGEKNSYGFELAKASEQSIKDASSLTNAISNISKRKATSSALAEARYMSDSALNQAVKRLKLETAYAGLTAKDTGKGMQIVQDILSVAGPIAAIAGSSASVALAIKSARK